MLEFGDKKGMVLGRNFILIVIPFFELMSFDAFSVLINMRSSVESVQR